MSKLNGGEALIQSLYREGIRTVFGIPGLGQYEAVDALYGMQHEMRYIGVRNEQAATYMADGYARASGEIAAALVVPGPGLLNAGAGMATAFAVSSPMLVITGVDHQREGWDDQRDPLFLHELTKWCARAHSVAEIPSLVREAMVQLRSGRPRPVLLEVPQEVLADRQEVTLLDPAPVARQGITSLQAAQAASWLGEARRPLIVAGTGVQRADGGTLLQELAEAWHAPIITTRGGKGVISDRHPLALGMGMGSTFEPMQQFIGERDVILSVGVGRAFSGHRAKVIHVNIDPTHPGLPENLPSGKADPNRRMGLVGDAAAVLARLMHYRDVFADNKAATPDEIHQQVARLNAARFGAERQLQPQGEITHAIRRVLPDDAMLSVDMTQLSYYSRIYMPIYAARSYFHCSRLWTLGAAFPMALGTALAQPNRRAVAIMGDGGFLYNAQELATAVQYEIPVVVVLFNDNAYGNVLRAQEQEFDGRILGTRLRNPDFIQLAQSYGVWSRRVESADELAKTLEEALVLGKPALIEMPVGPMQAAR